PRTRLIKNLALVASKAYHLLGVAPYHSLHQESFLVADIIGLSSNLACVSSSPFQPYCNEVLWLTPQRKATPTAASSTPHRGTTSNLPSFVSKGKSVLFEEEPLFLVPFSSISDTTEEVEVGFDYGNMDDWRKFKEVGLVGEAILQRKDHKVVSDKGWMVEKDDNAAPTDQD
ncbi:hypothetical protein Lal_00039685, partial [Lupinus albus]